MTYKISQPTVDEMKKLILKFIILLIIIIVGLVFILPAIISEEENIINQFNLKSMKITSSAFANNNPLPLQYGCQGQNINPPLLISGMPPGAVSLALIVDDPAAPGGDFVHWVMFNIPPTTSEIKENSTESGAITGTNDFNQQSWNGPCPPFGTHHYQFKIYALDKILDLVSTARKSDLLQAMNGHILDQALLIGTYQR